MTQNKRPNKRISRDVPREGNHADRKEAPQDRTDITRRTSKGKDDNGEIGCEADDPKFKPDFQNVVMGMVNSVLRGVPMGGQVRTERVERAEAPA